MDFEQTILIEQQDILSKLLGVHDRNLKLIKTSVNVHILIRDQERRLIGVQTTVEAVSNVISNIIEVYTPEGGRVC